MQHAAALTAATAGKPALRARLGAYLNLMKPHVTVMLLGTTLAAMAVAANGSLPLGITLATMLGGAMAAGSANAINCFWDRDIDEVMSRTRVRSLPAGRVSPGHALVFGIALGVASVALFAAAVNWLCALLALAAIAFYVGVYTMWLKRTTPQNIVIGGAAGAVPVLIGWAAVTGTVTVVPVLMFAIIFFWTPPHFWAVSLVLKRDYARAGVPMLPVAKGERETYRQILLYSVVLLLVSLSLVAIHAMGYLYAVTAIVAGGALIVLALRLRQSGSLAHARQLFWVSNYYLAVLFAAMVVDRILLGH